MKFNGLTKKCGAGIFICVLFFHACSTVNNRHINHFHRIELTGAANKEFQLLDVGPKFNLLKSGESYVYEIRYKENVFNFKSHFNDAFLIEDASRIEVVFSSDFKEIIIREDLTDGAPLVFYIYLKLDDNGRCDVVYWLLPVMQFDASTPLGVEFPHVESVRGQDVVLYYKMTERRAVVGVDDIKTQALPNKM